MSERREHYHTGTEPVRLRPAILDRIKFPDGSELKLEVLAPRGLRDDLATEMYYRILDMIDATQA